MSKHQGHIGSYEEIAGEGKGEELNQCPCEPACNCDMNDPCKGCETYGEWLNARAPSSSVTELVAMLEKYGTHTRRCSRSLHGLNLTCDCGWTDFSDKLEGTKDE